MIGLDTNVLVRYVVQDDPDQSARATALVESLDDQRRGFVSVVVLVELAWVLRRAYGARPDDVHAVVDRLLRARELVVQDADVGGWPCVWPSRGRTSLMRSSAV